MSAGARKLLVGLILLLSFGTLVGWFYGKPLFGLLVAVSIGLVWQVRQLLAFERALRTGDFDEFRYGEGIWEQIFSRFQFEHARGARRKSNYRMLLKEIRKSTDAMPDGAVILDANNEIVICNRAAKSLVGLKRKKDRGQRIDNILRDPKITRLVNESDFEQTVEIPSPIQDGDWLNCRVVPYGAEQKLLLLRDVTERIRLSKMRRDFVANASHELRSPLTVISGYLDALAEDEDMPSSWAKPVTQMRSQAQRMKQILAELLELSRLESAGAAQMDQPVDVVRLLNRVRNDFGSSANSASIVVNAESSAQILGIASEIESVVVNLLSNAIRYTPPDGQISLIWRSSPEGGELSVVDTGIGIAPEHLPRLTERFFRVDRGRSRDEGGIGLGLAIVKHVLARHDAELEIDSKLDEGSEFRCLFPAERVVVQPPATLS